MEATKLCGGKHGCGRLLPVSSFPPRSDGGFGTYCRECHRRASMSDFLQNRKKREAANKRWRDNNLDRCRSLERQRRERDKVKYFADKLLGSARRQKPCDLDRNWVMSRLQAGVCEITGVPFVMHGKKHPLQPSIDRINPEKPGHTKDNCQMVLWGINGFKGTASPEVFMESLKAVAHAIVDKV